MKIEYWLIGKTNEAYLQEGMGIFEKRLQRYLKLKKVTLSDIKNAKKLSNQEVKEKEGEKILAKLNPNDYLILLDERGKNLTSTQFARFMNQQLQQSYSKTVFLIGGAYGFAPKIYERANEQLALSKMTFSHQMIRLFFLEQLYRAMSILRNEPYHNE